MALNIFGRRDGLFNEATGIVPAHNGASVQSGAQWKYVDASHVASISLPPGDAAPISISDALRVPPVDRADQLYAGAVASFPLVAEGGVVPWLNSTFGAMTPAHRSVQTVRDLVFYGASVWWSDVRDGEGRPINPVHVPRNLWSTDDMGYVIVAETGQRMDQRNVIYFDSLSAEGFLTKGRDTVAHYHDLKRQILTRSRAGKPLIGIHEKMGQQAEQEEIEELMEDWVSARRSPNGSVAFIPAWAEIEEYGESDPGMLTDARNAVRLDVANHLNLPASMLDGNNQTSDTYSNTLQNTNEFLKLSLGLYLAPIERRLSQDDVTPPGVTVRFDTSQFDSFTDSKGSAVAEPEPTKEAAQ